MVSHLQISLTPSLGDALVEWTSGYNWQAGLKIFFFFYPNIPAKLSLELSETQKKDTEDNLAEKSRRL